ncbi:hypothetical protein CBS147346_912 [Aspergillus niger]|nr:hypothetical protein CBS147346_912 [Aspergillus niger]GLA32351.1 hypothetical protein AnigIFM63326_011495 [Aspergillus niger]
MPSIKALLFNALLATTFMNQAVSANALRDTNEWDAVVGAIYEEGHNHPEGFNLERRTSKPKLSSADKPSKSYACPKTDRYEATTYTSGQLTKAYVDAAKYANEGKQLGTNKYPHNFANYDKLPFECGSKTMEFVLDREKPGEVYSGGAVTTFPDRLIFEYALKGENAKAQFCGVIRHSGNGFVNCPSV